MMHGTTNIKYALRSQPGTANLFQPSGRCQKHFKWEKNRRHCVGPPL